jgi:ribonuclease BN (tRNA processing enzyme)
MGKSRDSGNLPRRTFLAGLAAAPALALAPSHTPEWWLPDLRREEEEVRTQLKNAKGTKLVLLGTHGGPSPGHIRHNTSNVIVHKGAAYVVDCGLGVTNQFARTGLSFESLRSIFITHHHPDHNIEYGPLLVIGWIYGLPQSVRAYGPPPLEQMTRDFLASQRATIHFWAEDFKIKPLGMIDVHELPKPGLVMKDENVRVTSVLVQHPPVKPAYGYRFDFPDRSIAFSGDTVPLPAVAQMARGADVLVHEAMDVSAMRKSIEQQFASGGIRAGSLEAFMHHMFADHSPVERVGRIAQMAGVKTLVLTHLVPAAISIPDSTWRALAAKHFKGEIIVGHDLLVV